MIRIVNFWNEIANKWEFGCFVKIIDKKDLLGIVSSFLGSVEYTDGSWLDIYNQCGILVGVEWFE